MRDENAKYLEEKAFFYKNENPRLSKNIYKFKSKNGANIVKRDHLEGNFQNNQSKNKMKYVFLW